MLDFLRLIALGMLISFVSVPLVGYFSTALILILVGLLKEIIYEVSETTAADLLDALCFIGGGFLGMFLYFLLKIFLFFILNSIL